MAGISTFVAARPAPGAGAGARTGARLRVRRFETVSCVECQCAVRGLRDREWRECA